MALSLQRLVKKLGSCAGEGRRGGPRGERSMKAVGQAQRHRRQAAASMGGRCRQAARQLQDGNGGVGGTLMRGAMT